MKRLLVLFLGLVLAGPVYAADQKVTEMTEDTAPTTDDLVMTVNDPGGTPVNRKVTIGNLTKGLTIANFPASANVVSLLSAADYAAISALLDLGINVKNYGAIGNGVADDSTAINAAITAAAGGTVFIPKGTYKLSAAIKGTGRIDIRGAGEGETILIADAGVDAIEIDRADGDPSQSSISGLSITGGRRGIYVHGGSYLIGLSIDHVKTSSLTAENIYFSGIDIQNGYFANLYLSGGTYGIRSSGETSSNVNTVLNAEFTGQTEAGVYLDGTTETYSHGSWTFINCVFESGQKYGTILNNVYDTVFLNCHWELNGNLVTGGPYANVAVLGRTDAHTRNITFESCINSALGANQDNLVLQVQDNFVDGPIVFRNNSFSGLAVVDLGSGAIVKLDISGSMPYSITGTYTRADITDPGAYPLSIYRTTDAYGVAFSYALQNSAAARTVYGLSNVGVTTNTAGAEDGFFSWHTMLGGTLAEKMRLTKDGNLAVNGGITAAGVSVVANPMDSIGDLIYGGASGVPTKLDAGANSYVLQARGAAAPEWTNSLTGLNFGGFTASKALCSNASGIAEACTNLIDTFTTIDGSAGTGPTAAQMRDARCRVSNYGQAAADVAVALPAPADNLSCLFVVETAQANKWGVQAATNDKITIVAADGTVATGSDNGYARMTAAQVYQSFSCWSSKTGASAWDWTCKAIAIGTSTFAAD